MLIFAKTLKTGINNQTMEANTLTRIDTTAQLNGSVYPDSTVLMLNEWHYSADAIPLSYTKFWLQDEILLFHQRNSSYFTRHDGVARTNKMMSESLLLVLLLLETLLVAYLIKNGLKFINDSIKNAFVSDDADGLSGGYYQTGSQIRQFLWILSIVVFALISPHLLAFENGTQNVELNSWTFLRLLLYVSLYFIIKTSLQKMVGTVFFNKTQTKRWIMGSKTTLSFYALSLTPILIGAEVGLPMRHSFLFAWIVGFLLISKFWLLIKTINIFSIRIGSFLYLILYLCALEILPILLFYKGLFLL